MSDYTKSTNFATKDNLTPGDPLKIVRGTEIDTEFNNIAIAIATKTDNASAAITGGSITGITDLAIADGGTGASTANAALNNLLPSQTSASGKYLKSNGTDASWDQLDISTADITGTLPVANGGTGVTTSTGTGSVVLSNSPTLVTPALGTPASGVATNLTGLPLTTGVTGTLPIANGGTGQTTANAAFNALAPSQATASGKYLKSDGTNTSWDALDISTADITGTLPVANGGTGVTTSTGTGSTVLSNSPTLVTPALGTPSSATLTNATGLPISTGVSGLGTGVATALAVNTGSSGAFVVNGGALGTPSSGTVTNLTGTASININGTVGATTPTTGAFTTLSASSSVTLSGGTANGVTYLNGSKVLTSGSALTFDGTTLGTNRFSMTGFLATFNNDNFYMEFQRSGTPFGYIGTGSNTAGGAVTDLGVRAQNNLVFAANATEQMRLTSTGLGIGTSSPSTKLHVDAGSLAPTSNHIARFDTTATTAYSSGGFVGGQLRVNYGNATNSYGGINFSNFGATSQDFFGIVQNSSGYGNFVWQGFNGSYGERMRLDSSGNLLVGTTSNSRGARLRVEGQETAYFTGYGNGYGIGLWMTPNASASGGTATAISFQNVSDTTVGTITTTSSATAYNTSSDYRLKENQQPLTGSGAFIDALQPKTWDWKIDGSKGVGFIAHEAQAVSPSSVTGEKDAIDENGKPMMQAMEYGSAEFIANIIAELQSLRKRLADAGIA